MIIGFRRCNAAISLSAIQSYLDLRADILQEIYMPTVPGKSRGTRVQKSQHEGTETNNNKKRKKRENRQASSFRRAYRGNSESDNSIEEDKKKLDDKLLEELSECLQNYSRQRLRAVHMSMRQYGNEASKISSKDVVTSLQENNVSIHDRTVKTLIEKFEDSKGAISLEALNKFLVEAHSKTGRDSVLAMRKRNDLAPKYDVTQEEIDEDLIWRIEALLIKSQSYIDIPELRQAFQTRDTQKSGKVEALAARQICFDQQMPVFGALLKNLMRRCDEEKNDKISWPEFLSFLETGQQNAWLQCPELKEIPEKRKSQTPVQPSLLDELSSRTRNTLVNKLRQKASIKKQALSEKVSKETNSTETKSEPNNNETTEPISKIVCDKSIREEPYIDVDKKSTLSKVDSKGTVSSVRSGTQVVIDIVPPDKEPAAENDTNRHIEENSSMPKSDLPDNSSSTNAKIDSMSIKTSPKGEKSDDPDLNAKPDLGSGTDTSSSQKEIEYLDKIANQNKKSQADKTEKESTNAKESVKSTGAPHKMITIKVKGKEVKFKVPTKYLANGTPDPPTERLKMQWVYGYRGNDCRKNIHVLVGGEILYFMSYIAIVYNRESHHQKHYKEHTDDIKSIDVHSDGLTVATGQFASRKDTTIQAHIRIWRSDTLQTLHVLGAGVFERAVACLAFSPGKDLLAAVDNSLDKKLTIWDTSSGEKKGEEILHTELICDIGFYRNDPETLVTIGKEHINWWKVYSESGTVQASAQPDYEGFLRAKFVICLTFSDRGDLVSGDSNGTIYIWGAGGNKITNYVKHAHDGPVFSVLCYKGYLFSGGRDGILHCWQINKNMDAAGFLQLSPTDGGIRMLQIQGHTLILGTTMNSLHLVTLSDCADKYPMSGASIDPTPITQCHYDDLRGLAVVPKGADYNVLTAGLDGIICGFDSQTRTAVLKTQMKGKQFLCIDADQTGALVALGTKDGHIHILHHEEADEWQEIINQKVCKDRLNVIRISQDKRIIAAGGQDSNIYLFGLQSKEDGSSVWEYTGKLQGHDGAISGLDWSGSTEDANWVLRSSSILLEQRYWDPITKTTASEEEVPAALKWTTQTCCVDSSLVGILANKYEHDIEIEATDISLARNLVVVGDNQGCLSLFRYPCANPGVYGHNYKSHAVVRNVRFSPDAQHVLSVGGRDSCLIQWETT